MSVSKYSARVLLIKDWYIINILDRPNNIIYYLYVSYLISKIVLYSSSFLILIKLQAPQWSSLVNHLASINDL